MTTHPIPASPELPEEQLANLRRLARLAYLYILDHAKWGIRIPPNEESRLTKDEQKELGRLAATYGQALWPRADKAPSGEAPLRTFRVCWSHPSDHGEMTMQAQGAEQAAHLAEVAGVAPEFIDVVQVALPSAPVSERAVNQRHEELLALLRQAVNASCECGGNPPEGTAACPACQVWHRFNPFLASRTGGAPTIPTALKHFASATGQGDEATLSELRYAHAALEEVAQDFQEIGHPCLSTIYAATRRIRGYIAGKGSTQFSPATPPAAAHTGKGETPETDAVFAYDPHCKGADFARTLERRLAAARAEVATGRTLLRQQAEALEHMSAQLATANAAVEEAKQQWRMSSVCREITAQLEQARSDLAKAKADGERTAAALERLHRIIDSAGVDKLMRGVELGQISWYHKAKDAMQDAESLLAARASTEGGK